MTDYLVFFAIQALIYAVVCLGLNLQWGYTGLFNIGVAGFFLVGAYAFAILCGSPAAGHLGGFGLPYVVGLVGALVAAAVVAFVAACRRCGCARTTSRSSPSASAACCS